MTTEQIIADAAEDANLRRYRQSRPGSGWDVQLLMLACGACGSVQSVSVQPGLRVVAFSCAICHRRTAAWCDRR